MKKIISFAVALVMLLAMSVPTALAAGAPDGVGEVAEGYTPTGTPISSIEAFESMEPGSSNYYYLTKSLDFSGKTYSTCVWNKSGYLNLDGCGYSLTGITISGTGDLGVFSNIEQGTVKNLNVQFSVTTGNGNCAGLTAISKTNSDKNVYFENIKLDVYLKGGKLGAFCGYSAKGQVNIKNCVVNGTVDGSASSKNEENAGVGGYLGQMQRAGTIENCTNNATVLGKGCTGGFIGRVTYGYKLVNCVNNGEVKNIGSFKGDTGTGGFIGTAQTAGNSTNKTQVIDCVNYANVTGGRDTGGIIGATQGDKTNPIIIRNCVNEGDITGGVLEIDGDGVAYGSKTAGIIAEAKKDLTVEGCVNKGAVSGYAGKNSDDGIGSIVGGFQGDKDAASADWKWTLKNNGNEGSVTNRCGYEYVADIVGNAGIVTVTEENNTTTTKAVGMLSVKGKAYVQSTELYENNKRDIRFILALDESALSDVKDVELVITVGERSVNFNTLGTLYRKFNAAELEIVGGEGVVLYGITITGVPDDQWNYLAIELTATDSTGAAIDALAISGSKDRT